MTCSSGAGASAAGAIASDAQGREMSPLRSAVTDTNALSPRAFFDRLFSNPSYRSHPFTDTQIWSAADLRVNRDPFDALICAAAMEFDLPLLTRDTDIVASKAVRVLW